MALSNDSQLSEDWTDIPLFAPEGAQIPDLSDASDKAPSSAVGALSHLLYDEETPEEKSELYRSEGNRLFKIGSKRALHAAIDEYSKAVDSVAVASEPKALSTALNNRAAAHLKLGNYGYALADALKAGQLAPLNVKAHYRAAVSATQLERLKEATEAVEEGLKACANGGGNNNDKVLLKRQLMLVDKKRKAVEQREARKQKREHRTHSVKDMLRQRGIQVSRRACYAQQREYGRTTPRWDEESGSWCWPLLLVYPTQAHGDQSDYVESVSEDATLRQVMELVFGNGEQQQMRPWWDVDNAYGNVNDLQVMLRQKRVEGEMDNIADAGDSDSDDEDEDEENGWQMEDKVQWTILDEQQRIGQVVTRRSYVVPLYPVLHIVPKAAARALANGCLQ